MKRDYEIVDVCHTVHDGMITYKGLPPPVISDHLTRERSRELYAPGTEFHIGKIELVANTGTYIDSPFHRYPQGTDLAGLSLYSVANVEGIVVRHKTGGRAIGPSAIPSCDVEGKAVLFHTRWDMHWRTETYMDGTHPFLTADAAELLGARGVALVGIDSYNIDDTSTGERPAHSILLANDIPIVEHLCGLGDLPDDGFRFFAVPVKVKNFGTFPVRAFGIVERPQTT